MGWGSAFLPHELDTVEGFQEGPVTEVTGPWQRGLLAAITPLWDVVVCLWPQHVLRPQQGAWAQLTWVLIPQRRVDSGLLLWACPSLGVHHWGSQGSRVQVRGPGKDSTKATCLLLELVVTSAPYRLS